jgi:hypothetical protein
MSKQPQRRLKTCNRRRLSVRRTSHNRRYMALSHQQVGYMITVKKQIRGNWIKSIASLSPLYMSLCAYFIAKRILNSSQLLLEIVNLFFKGFYAWNYQTLSTTLMCSFHANALITSCMTSHQKSRKGMLVSYQETMTILQAGQTKNVIKTQDSTMQTWANIQMLWAANNCRSEWWVCLCL